MNQAGIIRALTEAIDQGIYKYGDRLPTTRELASQYDTTQQTVATALTVMAAMGMVQVQRGWGSKVIASRPGQINLGSYRSANREVATGTTVWRRENGENAKEGPTSVSQTVATEADADTGIQAGTEVVERTRTRYDGDGAPTQHKRTLVTIEAATLTPDGWTGLPPMMSPADVIPPGGMSIADWLGMGVQRVVYDINTAPVVGSAATALTLPEGTPGLRIVSRGIRGDGSTAYATVTTAPLRSRIRLEVKNDAAEGV